MYLSATAQQPTRCSCWQSTAAVTVVFQQCCSSRLCTLHGMSSASHSLLLMPECQTIQVVPCNSATCNSATGASYRHVHVLLKEIWITPEHPERQTIQSVPLRSSARPHQTFVDHFLNCAIYLRKSESWGGWTSTTDCVGAFLSLFSKPKLIYH